MTKTLTLAFAVGLAVSASAQPQQDQAPPMPPMSLQKPNPAAANQATANSLKMLDAAIKDLNDNVLAFLDCADSIDYLKKDLASTKARLLRQGGGKIPSGQAGLFVIKTKRLGRQQALCLEQVKALDEHFGMAVRGLSGIQPPNHPGIQPRRLKILALREKFTAAVKKLGGAAKGKAAASSAEKDADEGSDK